MLGFPSDVLTFLMSSRKEALSPLNLGPEGPGRLRLATTLSSFREERHLAKTASPGAQRGGGGVCVIAWDNGVEDYTLSIPPFNSVYADFMVIENKNTKAVDLMKMRCGRFSTEPKLSVKCDILSN